MKNMLQIINMPLAFCLEVGMLFSYALWGYSLTANEWIGWLIAVVFVLIVAAIWGVWAAPKAPYRLRGLALFCMELSLLLGAAGLLLALGYGSIALLFALFAIVSQTLCLITGYEVR